MCYPTPKRNKYLLRLTDTGPDFVSKMKRMTLAKNSRCISLAQYVEIMVSNSATTSASRADFS
jgi:hypothetical protein